MRPVAGNAARIALAASLTALAVVPGVMAGSFASCTARTCGGHDGTTSRGEVIWSSGLYLTSAAACLAAAWLMLRPSPNMGRLVAALSGVSLILAASAPLAPVTRWIAGFVLAFGATLLLLGWTTGVLASRSQHDAGRRQGTTVDATPDPPTQ